MRTSLLASAEHARLMQFYEPLGDRGPARYSFVGREGIRSGFANFLANTLDTTAIRGTRGSTYLIQGPPGVGKTALLHELGHAARDWRVVRIEPDALHDPVVLAKAGRHEVAVSETRAHEVGGKLGFMGTEAGGGRAWSREYAGADVGDVIVELGRKSLGVLLVLDEAQDVADLAEEVSVRKAAKSTLRNIHNGEYDVPVVLLAGGLGHSQAAFEELGISRFRGGAVVNLGRLSDKSARELVEGYLREGEENREPARGQPTLVREILERSHGWPQHLVAYGESAQKLLPKKRTGHRITDDERQAVLARGDRARREYYAGRADNLDLREAALLGALVNNALKVTRWDKTTLDTVSVSSALEGNPVPGLREKAVAKGVLAEIKQEKEYHVPIPSMADWLVERYRHYQVKYPERAAELQAAVEAVFPPGSREAEVAPATKTMGADLHLRSEAMPDGLGSSRSEGLER